MISAVHRLILLLILSVGSSYQQTLANQHTFSYGLQEDQTWRELSGTASLYLQKTNHEYDQSGGRSMFFLVHKVTYQIQSHKIPYQYHPYTKYSLKDMLHKVPYQYHPYTKYGLIWTYRTCYTKSHIRTTPTQSTVLYGHIGHTYKACKHKQPDSYTLLCIWC